EAPLAVDLAREVAAQPVAVALVEHRGVEGAEPVPPQLLERDAVDLVAVGAASGDLLPRGAGELLERGVEVAGLGEVAVAVDQRAVAIKAQRRVRRLRAAAVLEDSGDAESSREAAVGAVPGDGLAREG